MTERSGPDPWTRPGAQMNRQYLKIVCIKKSLIRKWKEASKNDLGHDRLEIRMSDSMLDLLKPSDRFDNSETKLWNRETSCNAGFKVSSVVYKAIGVGHR